MTQSCIALVTALTFAASAVAQAAPLSATSTTAWSDPPAKSAPAKVAANASAVAAPATEPKAAAGAIVNQEPAAASPKLVSAKPMPTSVGERPQSKPRDIRNARFTGGQGGSWKTGRDSYGFAGSFGGCRFTGFAGPNGYRLDRVC